MTRTVTDAAMMMSVIAEPDVRDWYALPPADGGKAADYVAALERGVKGKKIAFSPTLGGHRVDPEIAKLVADAVKVFAELGAHVEEADPQLPPCGLVFQAHWFTGAANLVNSLTPEQQAMLDPGLREVAAAGAKYSLFDYFAAVKQREAIGLAMNRFHEKYELLLTPALPLPAFDAGLEWPAGEGDERWTDWTPFSYPFNLTRQPAASVPCGFTASGLPAGLQIVAPLFQDGRVLRASRAYEAARPFKMPAI